MPSPTIKELFPIKTGYVPYVVNKKLIPPLGVNPDLLYGVELEIEGLDESPAERAARRVPGMVYHDDGSLRNNGGEYVTQPMNLSLLDYVLNQFFEKNKLSAENYSERCSVHVHVNCLDMTLEQVRLLLCLYQILERILFNYIKDDRHENIFCVPWEETFISHNVLGQDDWLKYKLATKGWKKYTALNLLPLITQGTVEFRHMAGTHDKDRIIQWCDIIGCMFKYATSHTFDEVKDTLTNLNTSSAYYGFMGNVFPGEYLQLLTTNHYREFLEEGVINMKLALSKSLSTKRFRNDYISKLYNMPAEAPDDEDGFLGETPAPTSLGLDPFALPGSNYLVSWGTGAAASQGAFNGGTDLGPAQAGLATHIAKNPNPVPDITQNLYVGTSELYRYGLGIPWKEPTSGESKKTWMKRYAQRVSLPPNNSYDQCREYLKAYWLHCWPNDRGANHKILYANCAWVWHDDEQFPETW